MIFKAHEVNKTTTMINGFIKKDSQVYDVVLTLVKQGENTGVYGFVSKVRLNVVDILKLWKVIRKVCKTRYIVFKVLHKHINFYKECAPVIDSKSSKTYNNYSCELLKVDLLGKIKKLGDVLGNCENRII